MRIKLLILIVGLVLPLAGCSDSVVETDPEADLNSQYAVADQSAARVQRNFTAPLSGRYEIPPNDSQGTGVAIFHLDKEGTALDYKLNVANLDGITQSHIHCGAADVNGPVVAFLFGPAGGVSSNGTLAEGTVTAADIIARPDSPECPGGLANFDELIAKMRAGETYVNVHTLLLPPGEIRGQIK